MRRQSLLAQLQGSRSTSPKKAAATAEEERGSTAAKKHEKKLSNALYGLSFAPLVRRAERAVLLRWLVEAYSLDSRLLPPEQRALHLSTLRSVLQRMQAETVERRGGGSRKTEELVGSVAQAVKAAMTKKNMRGEDAVTV